MNKLKLSSKLIGGFLVIAATLLIGGFVGVLGITAVSGHLKSFVEVRVPETYYLAVLSDEQQNIMAMEQALLSPETFGNEAEKEKMLNSMTESWGKADDAWKKYEALARTEAVDAIWKKLQPAWESWKKTDAEFIGLIREGKRADALKVMTAKLSAAFDESRTLMQSLSDTNMKFAEDASLTSMAQASRLKLMALVGTLVGILMAFALAVYFIRSVIHPIYKVIANLAETSQQFAEAAGQISQSSSHLAGGTARQASAIEETYSVTEELKSLNAGYSDVINLLKGKLGSTNTIGMDAFGMMKSTKKAMKGIKQTSEETLAIVQTIEKIAFQTNLLALNASVEAARAGDAGSGFAVVSDDIRSLGARSTEAAKNSIALIGKTTGIASSGNDYIGLSIKKFVDYGTSSMQIYTYTEEAAKVAQKQLEGVNRINALVEEISRSAQSNAAGAEQASSVSEETTAQAMSVKDVVGELAALVGYKMR